MKDGENNMKDGENNMKWELDKVLALLLIVGLVAFIAYTLMGG